MALETVLLEDRQNIFLRNGGAVRDADRSDGRDERRNAAWRP